jgi:hypothetical protein
LQYPPATIFIGDKCNFRGIDEKTWVLTANFLFEQLSESVNNVVEWRSIRDKYPILSKDEISRAVELLISQNLLTFVDNETIKIHSHFLYSAYVDVLRKYKRVIDEAAKKLIY